MKGLLSLAGAIIGVIAVVLIIVIIASESGEVVVLNTRSDAGIGGKNTRVWVVDHGTSVWLRASSADAAWFRRLSAHPQVKVSRGEESFDATAQPKPEATAKINELMAEKYGWADAIVGIVVDRDDAIAIKLRVGHHADANPDGDDGGTSEMDLPTHWESDPDAE